MNNKCRFCGGPLVIEYVGSYGTVYLLKKDGTPRKKKMKTFMYEQNSGDEAMVYCWDCRRMATDNADTDD